MDGDRDEEGSVARTNESKKSGGESAGRVGDEIRTRGGEIGGLLLLPGEDEVEAMGE